MLDKILYTTTQDNANSCSYLVELLKSTPMEQIEISPFKMFLSRYTTLVKKDRNKMTALESDMIDFVTIALNRVKLSEKRRNVLDLYLCGYTEIEIAKLLGISKNTVNKKLRSITKKIVAELYIMIQEDNF